MIWYNMAVDCLSDNENCRSCKFNI
uniref:Uncharacterized protein n=1 Tax=Rhizophora mucronata TaxID=61149 RepID=A0A2P2NUE6_RHIMU